MSEENRQRAIRWMEDNWNCRRDDVIDELLHPDCVGRMEGGEVKGRDQWLQARNQLLASFSDLRMTVEQSVVEGDTVVLRWRVVGTHDGDGLGFEPSGREFEAVGSTWMKFADGKLVWGYDTWNQGALIASLTA